MYAISWFITFFSEGLKVPVVNKLLFLFVIEGQKVLIKFGIALLSAFYDEIMNENMNENLPQFLNTILSQITKEKL